MLKNVDDQKSRIWEEIIKEAQEHNKPLQDGEMTVEMFIEKTGLSTRWGREKLEMLVRSGKLQKRLATINGHRVAIYSPV